MRGLLFTGGKQPDMHIALPFFKPYSYVVAADSGLCGAESAGIFPDIIVGDMDSIPDTAILNKYPDEKIQVWPKDKDFTDTEIALRLMAERGIDEVILVGGCGGRLDHFFALKALFDGKTAPSMWIGEESIVITVENESPCSSVNISALALDDTISVFTAGSAVHECRSDGFHWEIDSLDWSERQYSLSNRTDSGCIEFKSISGRFLVIVPLRTDIRIERR